MKAITFLEGLGIAFGFMVLAIPLRILSSLVLPGFSFRATFAIAVLLYLLYLLSKRERKSGQLFLGIGGALGVSAIFLSAGGTVAFLFASAGLISLCRAIILYRSLLPAGLDFALGMLAAAFAVWSFQSSGSASGVLWTFFLVQAASAWIPATFVKLPAPGNIDSFAAASASAEEALAALIRRSDSNV